MGGSETVSMDTIALGALSALISIWVCFRFINRFRTDSLRLLDGFVLGFALTQCVPYVLHSLNLTSPVVAVSIQPGIPEWAMLLNLSVVAATLAGYFLSLPRFRRMNSVYTSVFPKWMSALIWLVCAVYSGVAMFLLIVSVRSAGGVINNMTFRAQLARLGPLVVLGNLIHGLFVVESSRRIAGGTGSLYRAVGAGLLLMPAAVLTGQRTAILMPLVTTSLSIYRLQGFRRSKRMIIAAALLTATMLVWVTSSYKVGSWGTDLATIIQNVFQRDVDTSLTLWFSLETWRRGQRILPYPFQGYVNAVFAFVPRVIAPFKGARDAQWLTAAIATEAGIPTGAANIAQMSWSFKLSYVTEAVLNGGPAWALVVAPFYGIWIAFLEAFANRRPAIFGPALVACFYLWWQDLFALITGILLVVACTAFVAIPGIRRCSSSGPPDGGGRCAEQSGYHRED